MTTYEPVIGLEVHCQLKTVTKMFTACPFTFGADPNTLVDAYTLGLPGTLPVPNAAAVDAGIKLALATDCQVHAQSRFARKHYFYPDLPKGYQITQSDHPYATGGRVEFPDPAGDGDATRTVRLTRIHFEEDAGKNVHVAGSELSLLDYNRAGAPLLEIVSEPDVRSAEEAAAYLRELRAIIRALGISDANMEQGTLRCDANVSLRPVGTETLGTRCEIKNMNSFRFLELAIKAEIRRQTDILESGQDVVQATMSYDVDRDQTRIMRTKEEAADYRYFPEPDMPPLVIDAAQIERHRAELPELPARRRARYVEAGVGRDEARHLTAEPELGDYLDEVLAHDVPAKKAATWLLVELMGRLNADDIPLADSRVRPAHVAELVKLVEDGTVSGRGAKEIFFKVYDEGLRPGEIVERDGYKQVSDTATLEATIREIMAGAEKQVAQFRGGNPKIKGWFVGQVMKQTRGQANPGVVNEILDRLLAEDDA